MPTGPDRQVTMFGIHLRRLLRLCCPGHAEESARGPWFFLKERKRAILSQTSIVHTSVAECAWNGGYIRHLGAFFFEDVPPVEFIYLVFTHMPGESYCRRLRSLFLCLNDVFRALIDLLVCWFNVGTVSKATPRKLLRDGVEGKCELSRANIDTTLKLN